MVYEASVAFSTATPPLRHWYDSVPVSGVSALTENVTDWPLVLLADKG